MNDEDDDLIKFDGEPDELSDGYSVLEDDEFDEETIEFLLEQVHESIDVIENIVYNMYYTHQTIKESFEERINIIMQENEKYREEIKKLYQELASNSNNKEN
jgi:uncharacterized protein Yka (UPF0111/DUF47 family)